MKKIYLIIILGIYSFTVFSQDRLGYTEQQIRAEFKNYSFHLNYDEGRKNIATFDNEVSISVYYFDEKGYCNECLIVPFDTEILQEYIYIYNENYIVVSETEWKKYYNNGVKSVKLIFLEHPTFLITQTIYPQYH